MSAPGADRRRDLRGRLGACDAALITSLPNIRYLTGFTGSSALFAVTPLREHLIVDFRYVEQARAECDCEVTKRDGPVEADFSNWLDGGRRCAVEAERMTVALWQRLGGAPAARRRRRAKPTPDDVGSLSGLDPVNVTLVPTTDLVEDLRIVKDAEEIRRLETSTALLESLMERAIASVRAGRREIDVAADFADAARRATGTSPPFEPIVASGVRGALPHGVASTKEIRAGELVTLDLGIVLDGYVADMTRTIAVGEVDGRAREIHEAVHLANRTAAKGIRPGLRGDEAHALAAGVLDASDLSRYFGHGLGHGIGIEIHENPRLSPVSKETLRPGMTFTVEPGVYIPEWGGVRIEDAGVLTEDGLQIFNRMDRSLIRV